MKKIGEKVDPYDGDEDYTKITFKPDFKRFGMSHLEPDIFELFKKRTFDLSGVVNKKVHVSFNGKRINIKDFKDYCSYYMKNKLADKDEDDEKSKEKKEPQYAYISKDRWELLVGKSDGDFFQVSFVNSICTTRGGTHVDSIVQKISEGLIEEAQKRLKKSKIKIKNSVIKNSIFIILNCLIENPAFDSQTKETLITKPTNFGSQLDLTEKFFKDLMKTGVIDQIVLQAEMKEALKMQKTLKGQKKNRLFGINKLEDANKAGTKESLECTLILTEGDSAKALAMAGLEVIGRDYYGVFPLRGKFLNVREASTESILKNQEVSNIIEIMGLRVGVKYNGDLSGLRYGSIMIMADQDHDGSHIKGLIINFFHHFWPDLIRSNKFLKEFVTPIIKASKGNDVRSFFTINDFKAWAESNVNNIKGWTVKYYKGLGTSDDKEAKEYFRQIRTHRIDFCYEDVQDDEAVELAFNRKKADDRKVWVSHFDPNSFVDHKIKILRYYDFIHKELIQFSVANNHRAIPHLCDGLKTGQRKILFACFKRKLIKEIKVAQLAGYVAEHTEYHHGEQNLAETIIGMAQNFVGSNNINLLMPNGQFGTRAMGGKDSASARYLHTMLNKVTRSIFLEADDHVLNYIEEDGKLVEPTFYLPIIPMVLVNGGEGIGTGWSSFVPNFNPREIAENLKARLTGGEFSPMVPYYKGYRGELIEKEGGKSYFVKGEFEYDEQSNTIQVTELPLHKWTSDYKKYIEEIIQDKSDVKSLKIEDLREYHTTRKVHFVLILAAEQGTLSRDTLEKALKITGSLALTNLVLFNSEGTIVKYSDPLAILEEYYQIRLKYYGLRKEYLKSRIDREIEILKNKIRFIQEVNDDLVVVSKRKKADIVGQLVKRGYTPYSKLPKIKSSIENNIIAQIQKQNEEQAEGDEAELTEAQRDQRMEEEVDNAMKEFNYLVSMQILSLSLDLVEKMKRDIDNKKNELDVLNKRELKEMWIEDIDNFLVELEKAEKAEDLEIAKADKMVKKPSKIDIAKPRKKKKVNKEENEEDDPDYEDDVKGSQLKGKERKRKGEQIEEEKPQKALKIAGPKGGGGPKRTGTLNSTVETVFPNAFKKKSEDAKTEELDRRINSCMLSVFAKTETDRERLRKVVSMTLDDFKAKDVGFMTLEEKIYMKELQQQASGESKKTTSPPKPVAAKESNPKRDSISIKDFFKQVKPIVASDSEEDDSLYNIMMKKPNNQFNEDSMSN